MLPKACVVKKFTVPVEWSAKIVPHGTIVICPAILATRKWMKNPRIAMEPGGNSRLQPSVNVKVNYHSKI